MGSSDERTNPAVDAAFVLPKHVRFARSLALVSAATVGIAAGAAVLGSGCADLGTSCSGICGVYGVQPRVDAQYDSPVDRPGARDAGHSDGEVDAGARPAPPDGHAGGGPRSAPHLPAEWLA